MTEKQAQMEAVYTHMWASHEGGLFAPLDESLHPRPHSILYEVAATCGVSASSLVLDVGSGRGNHSCALAQHLRKREYYQELLGASRYEVALANYHWALYILLGKLSPTLYILHKNPSS
jgi:tRNA G46 methylase TrmB